MKKKEEREEGRRRNTKDERARREEYCLAKNVSWGEKPLSFPIWAWGQDRSAIRPDLHPERKQNNRTCAPKRKKNDGGFSPSSICPVLHFSPDSTKHFHPRLRKSLGRTLEGTRPCAKPKREKSGKPDSSQKLRNRG